MKVKKRLLSLLLCCTMLFSLCPQVVSAEGIQDSGKTIGGLCEHHQEHTAECGYTEGTLGTPCNHEHNEDCYTLVTSCVHKHTADCYPEESVSDNTATPSDADKAEPTECVHECSEESGCITEELDCKHEHDSECDYSPATEGTPCGYVCEICTAEGDGTNPADTAEKPETECICKTLCTAEEANADCLVCGAEGADLTLCEGAEPETATPSEAEKSPVGEVQKLIDALPTVEDLQAMTEDGQDAVYADLQAAYEAYEALTDEQKAEITGTELLDSLFAFFRGKVNTLAEAIQYIEHFWNGSEVTKETKDISDYTEITADNPPTAWNDENGGWYVVTGEVEISERVTVTGDVYLILADNCAFTAAKGITVSEGNSLTIYAASEGESMGKLTATADNENAGIGGNEGYSGGIITIHGGDITATGDGGSRNTGAGIGGGRGGEGGVITIYEGKVTATGNFGAGIGGGMSTSNESVGNGGTITIYGGDITATSENGGAGIGGGMDNDDGSYGGDGGIISIYDGKIKATGEKGAGIGGGRKGNGGTIKIYGGTIEATATGRRGSGAGIGGGKPDIGGISGNGGTITITGGEVTAKSEKGAGIGGGSDTDRVGGASGGTISISGSTTTVTATGGRGCDVGGGAENTPSDKIEITIEIKNENGAAATIGFSHVPDTTKWSFNETQHWHPCQVQGCTVAEHQSDHADHIWNDGDVKETGLVFACTVCGYEKIYSCTNIEVTAYPRLEYDNRDRLDLSGLTIRATFGEGDDQEERELAYGSAGVRCYEGNNPYEVTNGRQLSESWDDEEMLYVECGGQRADIGKLVVKSTDTDVDSVTIGDVTEYRENNNVFYIELPFGSTLPTKADDIRIELDHEEATYTDPETTDGGTTWTFTVTAESGATQKYTLKVSVTPPTDTERITEAKKAIEGREWTVAQSVANDSNAVKSWIEDQLAGMSLYEVTTSVTVAACNPAGNNTNGSFTFTVTLTKGTETDATGAVTGTITATPIYSVTLNANGGTINSGNVTIYTYGEGAALPTADDMTYTGHTFKGWYETNDFSGEPVTEISNTATGNKTYYAKWAKLWTVTVHAEDGGAASGGGTFEENAEVTVTATPNSGYHFVRWTENGTEVSTSASYSFALTADRTLTAIFEAEYTITFDGNGGTSPAGQTTTGGKLTSLPASTQSGYSFNGWYTAKTGGDKITLDTAFTANMTVYAQWTKNRSGGGSSTTYYTLIFDTNGGSKINPFRRSSYGKTVDLSGYNPTRVGYDFNGWYSDAGLTNRITEIRLNGNKTIYAGWTKHNPGTGIDNPFTDVKESDWFFDHVMFVYGNGLMSGTSATTFEPNANTTRAQIAAIFYRMDGSPKVEGKNSFTDVPYGPGMAWNYDAVTWGQQTGVLGGYSNNLFGPNDPVTREQLAVIFYNYAKYKGYALSSASDLSGFTDAGEVSAWAQDAMKWAVGSGLMSGKGNNILDPKGTATRAEIAAMLHNFIERNHLVPPAALPGGNGGAGGWTQELPSPQTGDGSHIGL